MKAVIYTRVSTSGQVLDGVSLSAQKQKAEAWALANGYEILSCHEDAGISGKRAMNRPGLCAAIEAACKNKAALVCYSLSRLARSTKDAIGISERLEKAGADLVSLSEKLDTTTASGKLVFRLFAVLAEFERDLVSERTSSALQHKKVKGECVGNVEYGYRVAPDGVKLQRNELEWSTVQLIRELHGKGSSLRKIRAELESRGIQNRNGSIVWRLDTLNAIIKREVNAA